MGCEGGAWAGVLGVGAGAGARAGAGAEARGGEAARPRRGMMSSVVLKLLLYKAGNDRGNR